MDLRYASTQSTISQPYPFYSMEFLIVQCSTNSILLCIDTNTSSSAQLQIEKCIEHYSAENITHSCNMLQRVRTKFTKQLTNLIGLLLQIRYSICYLGILAAILLLQWLFYRKNTVQPL